MKKYLRLFAGPVFVLCMLVGSLWLLHEELRGYHLRDFLDSLAAIAPYKLGLAVSLTVLNFVILIGYDLLGIRYIRHPMPFRRVALASFLGYAVGNNFGTVLGGSTIRYRLYTAWGLSPMEIVKLVLVLSVTFWIGLFALAGVVFLVDPLPIPARLHLPVATTVPLGVVLALLAVSYPVLCALHRTPLKIRHWEFSPPPLGLALLQYVVAACDLMVASAVLYVLMPASLETGYFHFLAIYLLALVAAFLTQVPDAPEGVMEFLFIHLMLWGREQGYQSFQLGMAPLAGVESQPLAPLWNRVAALAYRRGEQFYNFRGLRQYKEKFDPVWTPKYLASPGGLALPVILTNVATLISGGFAELVKK